MHDLTDFGSFSVRAGTIQGSEAGDTNSSE